MDETPPSGPERKQRCSHDHARDAECDARSKLREQHRRCQERNRGTDVDRQIEPAEGPVARPDLARKFPLILISGTRSLYQFNSMLRDIPTLRAKDPEPYAEINIGTAMDLGINSGDMIVIESPHGMVQMKAAVTGDIHPKVVSVPMGWGRLANANLITDDENHDLVSGGPATRGIVCRVTKA